MPVTIGFAGKGSSGKSTLLPSLLAAARAERPGERRLVVDVDPHQSLTSILGHDGCTTVGQLRSTYERELLTGAVLREDEAREAFLEARMGREALLAVPGYNFLALGQWELAGSQCTPNRVMERALAAMLAGYDLALLDHEAGIEHLGRYTAIPLDALVIVATPARLSLDVARRVCEDAHRRGRVSGRAFLLLNRVCEGDEERPHVAAAVAEMQQAGVRLLGTVSEADDEPHALPADHPWYEQLAPLWSELLEQARHHADLRAAREAALSVLHLDDE